MDEPKGYKSCEQVISHLNLYKVSEIALLWCGVKISELSEHVNLLHEVNRGHFSHPYIPCFEHRSRVINAAINDNQLPACRENGKVVIGDYIAPERRHVRREDLKNWLAKEFPNDKPDFLFDEIERNTHTAINVESFKVLQLELQASKSELERAKQWAEEIIIVRDTLLENKKSLQKIVEDYEKKFGSCSVPNERSERTYLNIIAVLLKCIFGELQSIQRHPSFCNQENLIQTIVDNYGNFNQGLSQSKEVFQLCGWHQKYL